MPTSSQDPDLLQQLQDSTESEIDELDFGVIGFDADECVVVYNRFESTMAGISPERTKGLHLFDEVAPCTNNFLVAERFRTEEVLDEQLDYVFTLRMKPTPVHLRLLADPSARLRYMIVERPTSP